MIKFNTIRSKSALLCVSICGTILIAYSIFLYIGLRMVLYSDIDTELRQKTHEFGEIVKFYEKISKGSLKQIVEKTIALENEGPEAGVEIGPFTFPQSAWLKNIDRYDVRNDYIVFRDSSGAVLGESKNIPGKIKRAFVKKFSKLKPGDDIYISDIPVTGWNEMRVVTALYEQQGEKYFIQIGTTLKPMIHVLEARMVAILFSIPIILIILGFVGQMFTRHILKPVAEITKTAQRITHQDLSARIHSIDADQEMLGLQNAFNDMIARLEKSFEYISEFSSHIAHELKTPLAIIRGECQVALRSERTANEYKQVVEINLRETNRMIKTVEDMLLLTRLNYESATYKFEQMSFNDFLVETVECVRVLALEKQMQISLRMPDEHFNIYGDSLHLGRLFFNLIENAIKYSSERGVIHISVVKEGKNVKIAIADNGAGIMREDLSKIFDKFFHRGIQPDGQNLTTGTGLGLSMALSIAKSHGGNIAVISKPGEGSIFTVTLPALDVHISEPAGLEHLILN